MLVLTNSDVSALLASLSPKDILNLLISLATALQSTSEGTSPVVQPQRQSISSPPPSCNTILIMPAITSGTSSVKIASLDTSPTSTATSPTGSLLLFSPDGSLDAVLSAAEITAFRTALASMIPFLLRFLPELVPLPSGRRMAPSSSRAKTIVVFGAGLQAEWAIKLILLLFSASSSTPLPQSITIVNRSQTRAESLASRLNNWATALDIPCSRIHTLPYDPSALDMVLLSLVYTADAIFCCTPSRNPLFPAKYVDPASSPEPHPQKTRFISAIGSYTPEMQELDPKLFIPGTTGVSDNLTVIVDTVEGCLVEAGEVIAAKAIAESRGQPFGLNPLGQAWGQREKLLERHDFSTGNVIYKSVGMGIMDLAVAKELVELVRNRRKRHLDRLEPSLGAIGKEIGIEIEGF